MTLAYPTGYVELCSADKEAAENFKSAIPAENALLGCYTTSKDLEEWNTAEGSVFSSYLISTMIRATVKGGVTDAQFVQFKEQTKATANSLYEKLKPEIKAKLENAAGKLSEKYDVEVNISPGDVIPLGIIYESDRHLSSAWLADASYEVGGAVTNSKQVQVSTSILSHQQIFVLFTYGEYKTAADIEKYRSIAKEWTATFIRENE